MAICLACCTWLVTGYPKDCTDTKFAEKFAKIWPKITVRNSLGRTSNIRNSSRNSNTLYFLLDALAGIHKSVFAIIVLVAVLIASDCDSVFLLFVKVFQKKRLRTSDW